MTRQDLGDYGPKGASIPVFAAVAVAGLLLTGCTDPANDRPLRTAGYSGNVQLWQERATGCMFAANTRSGEAPRPLLDARGRQIGCNANTPAAGNEGASLSKPK